MTLSWATQVSFEPKWIGIGVERDAFTHELIAASGVFSLCIIDREDRAIVRKFTKPVDVDLAARTLNGFAYLDGPATGAPVLAQSVAYVECEVRQPVNIGNHTLFLGEVDDAAFLQDEETEVLRIEDTRMSYGG
jgi:flavin reductase (DIM6/NTAB) family NADH-FMN oxidoreductase RutF